ncbi:MAG TPA: hypothetical protein V6D23_22755, partial [Candidatus Obscuribacterales bacterium]
MHGFLLMIYSTAILQYLILYPKRGSRLWLLTIRSGLNLDRPRLRMKCYYKFTVLRAVPMSNELNRPGPKERVVKTSLENKAMQEDEFVMSKLSRAFWQNRPTALVLAGCLLILGFGAGYSSPAQAQTCGVGTKVTLAWGSPVGTITKI